MRKILKQKKPFSFRKKFRGDALGFWCVTRQQYFIGRLQFFVVTKKGCCSLFLRLNITFLNLMVRMFDFKELELQEGQALPELEVCE